MCKGIKFEYYILSSFKWVLAILWRKIALFPFAASYTLLDLSHFLNRHRQSQHSCCRKRRLWTTWVEQNLDFRDVARPFLRCSRSNLTCSAPVTFSACVQCSQYTASCDWMGAASIIPLPVAPVWRGNIIGDLIFSSLTIVFKFVCTIVGLGWSRVKPEKWIRKLKMREISKHFTHNTHRCFNVIIWVFVAIKFLFLIGSVYRTMATLKP